MGSPRRRDRGALEAEILAALGAAGRPMTPRQVHTELGGALAYTTVMTTLARLSEKGALTRERVGRSYSYRPAGDQQTVDASVTARRMRRLLDAGTDRNVALTRFVAELEPEDEQLLVSLLRDLDADKDSPGP
ncbi:BlaI/MecI/CopY family transcriptional regulator [Kribbella sp.]|uniref:BlaI/MecI/CopY family transcriptional regulator n=1 Tax=Kribbella sp. TaxID=1871183 RepID=UPI002D37C132|nr:BlaI/MecI/CopY family transcriptional regulator [Kribbella sp.]HZX04438.1 BlaI/MecI/CopY family transcriptional regulator [Kribbella sp.]